MNLSKEPVIKNLIILLIIVAGSFIGIVFAKSLMIEAVVAISGFFMCLALGYIIFQETLNSEKNQLVLKEQNKKIIRKSIELSDVMRQFEDKNYDLELSRKVLNHALSAIKEKERDQRIIFEKSPLGIIRLDSSGKIKYCNNKFSELMASPKDKLIGQNFSESAPAQMADAVDKAVHGENFIFEGEFFSFSGRKSLDLRVVFNPVQPDPPTDVIATIEDISKRVKAEKQLKKSHAELEILVKDRTSELIREIEDRKAAHDALKKSEAKYRSILENIEDAYFELDLKGNMQFFNNALPDLLEDTKENLVGMNYREFAAREDIPLLREVFESVFKTGRTSPLIHCHAYTRNNQVKLVGIIVSLIKNKKDEPVGFRGLARDVTRQRIMETRLQQAQKMEAIGNLAGGVAHDFNNILGAIIGYTQLVKKHSNTLLKIQPYIEQIIKASERAKGLVRQILLFSRNTESEKVPSDIVLVAEEVLKLLRASIPSTIEIRHRFDDHLNPVMADHTQIHQVFMNLCSNAAYAMKKMGGCLTLELTAVDITPNDKNLIEELSPGQYVKITVNDTGTGMDRQILDRIFDPYFTTKEAGEGTGLGLATVHGIIKDHGGVIRVQSQLEVGTTFHIYLPTIEENIVTEQIPIEVKKGSEVILFVDDEDYLADVGKEMLEDYGYQVTATTSSKEALELFEQNPNKFDLVITDFTMPELTGAQLTEKINAINPDVPVVMCTGISLDPEVTQGLELKRILMKPLDMDGLLFNVREILDQEAK